MHFNSYIWSLYKQSAEGQTAIRLFEGISENTDALFNHLATLDFEEFEDSFELDLTQLVGADPDPAGVIQEFGNITANVNIAECVAEYVRGSTVASFDDAARLLEDLISVGIPVYVRNVRGELVKVAEPEDDEFLFDDFPAITLGLHFAHPEFFFPYFFKWHFDRVVQICEAFGIPLPEVPGKRDTHRRLTYYASLCQAFGEFRVQHNLSSAELCAFLYSFGQHFVERPQAPDELPDASKVWIVGAGAAGSADFDAIDSERFDSIDIAWQGNPDTRKGDIVIMYCLAPRSYVHSIWRAVSDGYRDPFFWYYGTVRLGFPISTAPVHYSEFKNDPTLSKMGLVRGNMQGINGRGFRAEEYDALLRVLEQKGQDTSILPRAKSVGGFVGAEISDERDVEIRLVEPLLDRLGYKESDWIRQMPVRMGRGIRYYPDYAFGATARRGDESARMVIEAKYSITTRRQLFEWYQQAKSYALRLQAMCFVVASQEGIWIFEQSARGFHADSFTHFGWDELALPDEFHRALLMIGRKAILGR